MKKILFILLFVMAFSGLVHAQTTPVSPSQMNQVTWYYEPSTTLRWGFNATRGWFLVPDSAKVVQWIGGRGGGDTVSFQQDQFINTGTPTNAHIALRAKDTTGVDSVLAWKNNKLYKILGGGGGITALTGDVTASGTGSVAATLATVNSNVGSFGDATHVPAITVNAKGLTTAVTSTAITFPVTASNSVAFTNKSGNISQWTNDSGYGTGTLTAVTGTANRITSTGGTTPAIDISASYVGQSSITTVGTLSAGSIPYSLLTGTPSALPPSGTAGGELAGTYPNPTLLNSAVIAKVLTGYTSGSGTVASTDNILQAIQKLNGNDGLKAPIASPTFTGTVTIPNGGVFGTPTSMIATNVTGLPLTTGVTGLLPVANGGTGTATPGIVAGTNITVTGTWPNQTVNSTASGGTFTGDIYSLGTSPVKGVLSSGVTPITLANILAFDNFGDSITLSFGNAALTDFAYSMMLRFGLPGRTSYAVSGTGVWNQLTNAFPNINNNTTASTWMAGLNDLRGSFVATTPTFNKISSCLRSFLVNNFFASLASASSTGVVGNIGAITHSGTWANFNASTYGSRSQYIAAAPNAYASTAANSTLTVALSGVERIVIGTFTDDGSVGNTLGGFTVLGNGTDLLYTYSPTSGNDGINPTVGGPVTLHRMPDAIIIEGIEQYTTIVIKATTSTATIIDYIATLATPKSCAPVFVSLIPNITNAQWATTSNTSATRDATDPIIRAVVAQLSGFPIVVVDPNVSYNPNTMSSDGIHPTAAGQSVIADQFCARVMTGWPNYNLVTNNTNNFIGLNAGSGTTTGTLNVGLGINALNHLSTGLGNDAIGNGAMGTGTVTGNSNEAMGQSALAALTSGGGNVAIGTNASIAVTNATFTTAVGYNALEANVSSSFNSAFGYQALAATTGANNTGLGMDAGFSITSGTNNTAAGLQSMLFVNGSFNAVYGAIAGRFISGGVTSTTAMDNSVMMGYDTRPLANSQTNQIVIGYQATGNGSNTATIGNSSITNNYFSGTLNVAGLTASKVVFTDASKNLTSTGIGISSQYIAGDGSLGTIGSRPHTIFTPTPGGTVALTNNQYNIINPAGALLALTVNLPSSPANNDCVFIKFTQNVTTVTYGNGTVVDGITAPTAGGLTVLVYDSSSTSWY